MTTKMICSLAVVLAAGILAACTVNPYTSEEPAVEPAIAIDQIASDYISPAALPVTMVPPAPGTQLMPMKVLATALPSRVLLPGKTKTATRHPRPSQFVAGKPVTHTTSDEIHFINNADGTHAIAAADGDPGAGTYGIGPVHNQFTTNANGKDIRLHRNVRMVPLRTLPVYKAFD